MCSNCFDADIESFANAKTFENFEKELELKLRASQGLFYFRQSPPGELISYTIYGCKSCNSKWYLNIPVAENSGCFLVGENFQPLLQKVKKNDSRWRTGIILFCLLVMFVCLILLISMN